MAGSARRRAGRWPSWPTGSSSRSACGSSRKSSRYSPAHTRTTVSEWLPLPYAEWRETRDTLQLYTQVIGKLRLALSPFQPHWMKVPLSVTARGLTSSPLPIGSRTPQAHLDFVDNALMRETSDGRVERPALGGAGAGFYPHVMRALARPGGGGKLSLLPQGGDGPIPFPAD